MSRDCGDSISIREFQVDDLSAMADMYADAFAYGWSADEIAAFMTKFNIKTLALEFQRNSGRNKLLGVVICLIVAH